VATISSTAAQVIEMPGGGATADQIDVETTNVADDIDFKKYDTDGDGKLSTEEYNSLQVDIRKRSDKNVKIAQELKSNVRSYRTAARYATIIFGLVLVLLVLSFVGNGVMIDRLVRMDTKGTILVAKGTHGEDGAPLPVRTAETNYQFTGISSRLSNAALQDLKGFQVTSDTGAYTSIKIQGFMKLPAQPCRDPVVKFVTAVGTIILEGTELTFDNDVAQIFLESGLKTFGLAVGPGSDDRRRKLVPASLTGFFTTLENAVQSASDASCLPALPTEPYRWKGYSKRLDLCTHECVDNNGFVTKGLVGTEVVGGVVYKVREIYSLSSNMTLPSGTQATQFKRVTKFPRYPEVTLVQVNNGSHGMEWLEYAGSHFQCRLTDGWPEGTNPDPTEKGPYDPATQGSATTTRVKPPAGTPGPQLTYEGLTTYNSERYNSVESFKYRIEPLGGNDGIHLEYYTTATAAGMTKPLGMHAFRKDAVGYKLTQRSDYFDHTVNAEVLDSEVTITNFAMLSFDRCVTSGATIVQPPDPRSRPVGKTERLSDGTWGASMPIRQPNATEPAGNRRKLGDIIAELPSWMADIPILGNFLEEMGLFGGSLGDLVAWALGGLPFKLDFGIDKTNACFKILAGGAYLVNIEGAIAACWPNKWSTTGYGKIEIHAGCQTVVDAVAPGYGNAVCGVLDSVGLNNPKWVQGFMMPSVGFGVSQYCESAVHANRNSDPPIMRDSYFLSLLGQVNINVDVFWVIYLKLYLRERIVFVHQDDWGGSDAGNGFQFYIEMKLGLEFSLPFYEFADEFNAAPGSAADDTPDCGNARRYYVQTEFDSQHYLMQQMPGNWRGKKARTPAACTAEMACVGWDTDPNGVLNRFVSFYTSMAGLGQTMPSRPSHCQYGDLQPKCTADRGPATDGVSAWETVMRPSCSNQCQYAGDFDCDDGGPGAEYNSCLLGTDCQDCGSG
jgi:hypothetical protein